MKKTLALVFALMLALSLTACGGGSSGGTTTSAPPAAPAVDDAAAAFLGTWEYVDYYGGYIIYADGECDIVWQESGVDIGSWQMEDDYISVYNSAGEWYADLSIDPNGNLCDEESDRLMAVDEFSFLAEDAAPVDDAAADFVGVWEYDEYYGGYMLYEDGSAYIVWQESGADEATWSLGGDCVTVYDANGEWYADLSFTADGNLIDDSGDRLTSVADFTFEY